MSDATLAFAPMTRRMDDEDRCGDDETDFVESSRFIADARGHRVAV